MIVALAILSVLFVACGRDTKAGGSTPYVECRETHTSYSVCVVDVFTGKPDDGEVADRLATLECSPRDLPAVPIDRATTTFYVAVWCR